MSILTVVAATVRCQSHNNRDLSAPPGERHSASNDKRCLLCQHHTSTNVAIKKHKLECHHMAGVIKSSE